MNKFLLLALLALTLPSEAQQACFGSSCPSSGGGSSTVTSGNATSGFTANSLIWNGASVLGSGPKFLSGNLSLEVGTNYCSDSGANDTYVCTLAGGSLSAYSTGTKITLKANTANTGTATVAVDGLAAITITRRDDSALQTGDISAGDYVPLVYDGNTFRLQRGFQSGVTYDGTTFAVTGAATSGIAIAGQFIGGTGTSAGGLKVGAYNATLGGFWSANVTPSATNYSLVSDGIITAINSTSSLQFNINDTLKLTLTATGLSNTVINTFTKTPVWASTVPAVSNTSANSCGTDAATIAGTSETGIITVGATSGTSCTMTFPVAAPTRRQCVINNETTANLARAVYSSTTVSLFEGTFVGGDVISYVCQVY